jgi:hypothetical protein
VDKGKQLWQNVCYIIYFRKGIKMQIIVTTKEEEQLIKSMCDLCLKAGGIQNLKEVQTVLEAVAYPTVETK